MPEYIELSNVFSGSESILMYWIEINNKQLGSIGKRLINFDENFKDGQAIASIV